MLTTCDRPNSLPFCARVCVSLFVPSMHAGRCVVERSSACAAYWPLPICFSTGVLHAVFYSSSFYFLPLCFCLYLFLWLALQFYLCACACVCVCVGGSWRVTTCCTCERGLPNCINGRKRTCNAQHNQVAVCLHCAIMCDPVCVCVCVVHVTLRPYMKLLLEERGDQATFAHTHTHYCVCFLWYCEYSASLFNLPSLSLFCFYLGEYTKSYLCEVERNIQTRIIVGVRHTRTHTHK